MLAAEVGAVPVPPPAAAAAVFGAGLTLAARYADLLVTTGIEHGVIGPGEAPRVWERHLFNSAALSGLVPAGARVIDLGSGAGLPGIPLALARPDLEVVLLEPMARRVRFLTNCLAELGQPQIAVCRARAEPGVTAPADVVVARAVAPLARLVELAAPLLADGGTLLALKGMAARREYAALPPAIRRTAEVLTVDAPGGEATVVRVTRPTWLQRARRSR